MRLMKGKRMIDDRAIQRAVDSLEEMTQTLRALKVFETLAENYADSQADEGVAEACRKAVEVSILLGGQIVADMQEVLGNYTPTDIGDINRSQISWHSFLCRNSFAYLLANSVNDGYRCLLLTSSFLPSNISTFTSEQGFWGTAS